MKYKPLPFYMYIYVCMYFRPNLFDIFSSEAFFKLKRLYTAWIHFGDIITVNLTRKRMSLIYNIYKHMTHIVFVYLICGLTMGSGTLPNQQKLQGVVIDFLNAVRLKKIAGARVITQSDNIESHLYRYKYVLACVARFS